MIAITGGSKRFQFGPSPAAAMWQIIARVAPQYARYVVFPAALVIGAIGYYAEKQFGPKQQPIKYLDESIQEQRERRIALQNNETVENPKTLYVLPPRKEGS
ncbi:hypothetical protein WR25_18294 [Diploscapter pachys]|uniref:Small integral membrane protein 12 n=1 Tax=Diploscapter pachys TaxID=2018661 RepID=A0A2A2LEJ6_9BILA|nr:hypothetical protein WR25_18294 [Diploscapter pachys]